MIRKRTFRGGKNGIDGIGAAERKPPFWSYKLVSKIHKLDITNLPHAIPLILTISRLIELILKLFTLFVNKERLQNGIKSGAHVWFFCQVNVFVDYLRFEKETLEWLVISVFFATLSKYCFLASLLYMEWRDSKNETSDYYKILMKTISVSDYIKLTVVITPLVAVLVQSIFKVSPFLQLVSILCLISFLFDLSVHNILTYDYRFMRENRLQGRGYSLFSLKVLLVFLSDIICSTALENANSNYQGFSNFFQVLAAFAVFTLRIRQDTCLFFPRFDVFLNVVDAAYLWFSISLFTTFVFPDLWDKLDFDILSLICVAMMTIISSRISIKKRKQTMFDSISDFKDSPADSVYFLENLHLSFQKFYKDKSHSIHLSAVVVNHTKSCKNPYCMCFILKANYDQDLGPKSSVIVRGVIESHQPMTQRNNQNHLAEFNDITLITDIREKHSTIVTSRILPDSQKVEFETVKVNERLFSESSYNALNLDIEENNLLFLSSLFSSSLDRDSSSSHSELVLATLRFLTWEYSNPVAVLLLCYSFIDSIQEEREVNMLTLVKVENFIGLAKSLMLNADSKAQKAFVPGLNLTSILEFQTRVESLSKRIAEMFREKLEVYSILSEHQINYKTLLDVCEGLSSSIDETKKEVSRLLCIRENHFELVRNIKIFYIDILERKKLPARFKMNLSELVKELRQKAGSMRPDASNKKAHHSVYNSANVVLFAGNKNSSTFRMTKFSPNASELFQMSPKELIGAQISDFMHKSIGERHDRVMINFLNGQSKRVKGGRVFTALRDKKGVMKSVLVMPKMECLFLDEVLVAALVTPRTKNNYALIFCEPSGLIIGSNPLADRMIAKEGFPVENTSLFCMFPRLIKAFEMFYTEDGNTNLSYAVSSLKRNTKTIEANEEENLELKEILQEEHYQMKTAVSRTSKKAEMDQTHYQSVELFFYQMHCQTKISELKSKEKITRHELYEMVEEAMVDSHDMILKDLKSIFSTSISMETNLYQENLGLVELSIDSIGKINQQPAEYFRQAIHMASEMIFEVLMMSPESMRSMFKLSKLMREGEGRRSKRGGTRQTPLIRSKVSISVNDQDNLFPSGREDSRVSSTKLKTKEIEPIEDFEITFHKSKTTQTIASESLKNKIKIVVEEAPEEDALIRENLINAPSKDQAIIQFPDSAKKNKKSNSNPFQADHLKPTSIKQIFTPINIINFKPQERKSQVQDYKIDEYNGYDELNIYNKRLIAERVQEIKRDLLGEYESQTIDLFVQVATVVGIHLKRLKRATAHGSFQKAVARNQERITFESNMAITIRGDVEEDSDEGIRTQLKNIEDSEEGFSKESVSAGKGEGLDSNAEKESKGGKESRGGSIKERSSILDESRKDMTRKIREYDTRLNYRKIYRLLVCLTLMCMGMFWMFAAMFRNKLTSTGNFEEKSQAFVKFMKPISFAYKQSVKCLNRDALNKGNKFLEYFVKPHSDANEKAMSVILELLLKNYYEKMSYRSSFIPIELSEADGEKDYWGLPIFPSTGQLVLKYNEWLKQTTFGTASGISPAVFDAQYLRLCHEISALSMDVYTRMFDILTNVENDQSKSISSAYILSFSRLIVNFFLGFCITVLIIMIDITIYKQVKKLSDLIHVVRKELFIIAISNLEKSHSKLTKQELKSSTGLSTVPSTFQGSYVASSLAKAKPAKFDKRNYTTPIFGKKKPGYSRDNFSRFVDFPKQNKLMLVVGTVICILMVNTPNIIDSLMQDKYYNLLSENNRENWTINYIETSLAMIVSFQYRELVALDSNQKPDPGLGFLKERYEVSLKGLMSHTSNNIFQVLLANDLCRKESLKASSEENDPSRCFSAVSAKKQVSLKKAVEELNYLYLEAENSVKSDDNIIQKSFLERPDLARYDLLIYYIEAGLDTCKNEFSQKSLSSISNWKSASSTSETIYILMFIGVAIIFQFVWLPKKLRLWKRLQCLFSIINQDLLQHMHLKSYLGLK